MTDERNIMSEAVFGYMLIGAGGISAIVSVIVVIASIIEGTYRCRGIDIREICAGCVVWSLYFAFLAWCLVSIGLTKIA